MSESGSELEKSEEAIPEESLQGSVIGQPGSLILFSGGKGKKYTRFVLAALGSIPWVGGVLGAAAALSAENDQEKINQLIGLWLQEHEEKIEELKRTIEEILTRLDGFGEEIQKRIESPTYLLLVRKAFKAWDESDTKEKRDMVKRLITNAGATSLCPDDLIRLFTDWIDRYHEAHFLIIRALYNNKNVTRGEIWDAIYPERPAENSPEADLFKLLISDLSLGHVIRQAREVNFQGQFVKKSLKGTKKSYSSGVMESAFENTKQYELTGLGSQFVHYVMNDVVPRLSERDE